MKGISSLLGGRNYHFGSWEPVIVLVIREVNIIINVNLGIFHRAYSYTFLNLILF